MADYSQFNTCRFCGKSEFGKYGCSDKLVKYGTRHYAHHACYLDAGKTLEELPGWMVGNFPFRVLKDRGLLDKAEGIYQAYVSKEVSRIAEQGRRP